MKFTCCVMLLLCCAGCSTPAAPPPTLNLNTATADELSRLPRVGPGTAQRIVEYRTAHGPFASLDGLLAVRGVDRSVLTAIRPLIAVGDTGAAGRALIDLNTATIEDLAPLPGIGRNTAACIIAHRQKNGPYDEVSDLLSVRSITPQKYEQFRQFVTVR